MGKAYTEEEKQQIRERIWEAGIEMFHSPDAKSLSVRAITAKVGISLGSFYNFYPDKESLVIDIMKYRVKQKLEIIKKDFPKSEKDPVEYLNNVICGNFISMDEKFSGKEIYKGAYALLLADFNNVQEIVLEEYAKCLEELNLYWKKKGIPAKVEVKGIVNLVKGLTGFAEAKGAMDRKYYDELLVAFIKTGVDKYLKVEAE